jgi:EAL domain-containing protein (putative c-di-GMP-specific phosphodiesterase class I)/FixJ family two-component response regulator
MSSSKPVLQILDDDGAFRALASRVGQHCGFRTEAFAEPADFLAAIGVNRPELIILDIVLGKTGWSAVLAALSRLRCTTPVIVSSGIDERLLGSAVRIGEKLGLNMLSPLRKPAGAAELFAALSAAARNGQPISAAELDHVLAAELSVALPDATRNGLPISAAELDHAIAAGQMVPYYQPKVRVTDRKPIGAEALVRWEHPARGTLGPDVFLPLAEQGTAIMRLTDLMVERAAADCAVWHAKGHDVSVAVNIPACCLVEPGFADRVAALAAKAGAEPAALSLEITETAAMANTPVVIAALARLTGQGFALSMDDFGTGCSSLAELHRMPFRELKIDRSFISSILNDREAMVITRTVIGMAQTLGLRTVAEGVESAEVLAALDEMGCDMAQGFPIGRPMPLARFLDWLAHGEGAEQPIPPAPLLASYRTVAA